MKRFAIYLLASIAGTVLAFVLLGFLGVFSLVGLAASSSKPKVKTGTVLKMTLNGTLPELKNNKANNSSGLDLEEVDGLHDVIRGIRAAKDDPKIEGIYMELSQIPLGRSSAREVRQALEEFKESDKFIISYADNYSQGAYYMASVADEVYLNPFGSLDFRGFGGEIMFYKGLMDKLGIKGQIYYAGKFKSATEPFRRTNMSAENKKQVKTYLNGLYRQFLDDIGSSRNITRSELHDVADNMRVRFAEDAVKHGLVDSLKYKDEIIDILKGKLDLEPKKKITSIGMSGYLATLKNKVVKGTKNKVAVVFAEGSIVDGQGGTGSIGGEKYSKLIRKIRQDENVKAIVLRVNSGGGSGYASEQIWRELMLAKRAGIPVIASMGDVAASGGYYISACADTIVAESNTITGSIGVFGMIPSLEGLFENKLGITFDTVLTAKFARGISMSQDLSAGEGKIVQDFVDDFYSKFLGRVAQGRGMDTAAVHEIAQGRVWLGDKAKELGLVDVLGGLEESIEIAANKAGIEKYRIRKYPSVKTPMESLMEELQSGNIPSVKVESEAFGLLYKEIMRVKEIESMKGVQARIPYTLNID